MQKTLHVVLDQKSRQQYIDDMLAKDGLSHIKEDPKAAYCPISLTQTPEVIKKYVAQRQDVLMNEVLAKAGLMAYDPSTAPYSPDTGLAKLPQEIYLVDSSKIAGSRFFVGHNLTASTGFGVELEKAIKFNRIAVILFDENIRISRMQPHRVIYLQYHDFVKQASDFVKVFQLLLDYEPGMGFDGKEPVLIGFNKKTNAAINLEKMIYDKFPELKYVYNGQKETLNLGVQNPELFREFK